MSRKTPTGGHLAANRRYPSNPRGAHAPARVPCRALAAWTARKLKPYRDITDPVEWQREMREDRPLPGRD